MEKIKNKLFKLEDILVEFQTLIRMLKNAAQDDNIPPEFGYITTSLENKLNEAQNILKNKE